VESTAETTEKTGYAVVSGQTEPLNITRFAAQNTLVQHENTVKEAENPDLHTLARRVMKLQADNVQKPEIMRQIWGGQSWRW